MTRFSEIAHDIESQFDPDYDIDPDSGAPSVRYIEHRLLELCEDLDARLTALEAKPQAADYWRKWAAAEVERLTAELDAARAERDNLAAERKSLDAENAMLAADIDELTRQHDNLGNALDKAAADVKERTYERDTLGAFVDALKADNKRLTAERDQAKARYNNLLNSPAPISIDAWQAVKAENARLADRLDRITVAIDEVRRAKSILYKENERLAAERNALAAEVDDLRNVNAGLREHNAVLRKGNERLRTVNETDNAKLRAALEAIGTALR